MESGGSEAGGGAVVVIFALGSFFLAFLISFAFLAG